MNFKEFEENTASNFVIGMISVMVLFILIELFRYGVRYMKQIFIIVFGALALFLTIYLIGATVRWAIIQAIIIKELLR